MDRVLEKIFWVGSGMDRVRVLASYLEPIGYYRVLKNLIGYFSGISSMWHIYFMECLVRDFKWCIYGESNQKVKVLLEFCAPPFCGSFSIDCLKLRMSWVVEMLVSPKVPVFKYREMVLWVPKQKTEAIFYANHPQNGGRDIGFECLPLFGVFLANLLI